MPTRLELNQIFLSAFKNRLALFHEGLFAFSIVIALQALNCTASHFILVSFSPFINHIFGCSQTEGRVMTNAITILIYDILKIFIANNFINQALGAVILRLNSVAGFAEPALPLIGHTQTQPQTLPRGDTH